MAAIREELILADRFSATFNRYTRFLDQATRASAAAEASQRRIDAASRSAGAALEQMAGAALDAATAMGSAGDGASQMAESCERASRAQEQMNESLKKGQIAASGLGNRLLSLAKAYMGVRSVQAFANLTDTFTQTTARLDRMNDGLQTTAELQDMVYQASMRPGGGSYQEMLDMVSKLGTMAPDAFNSNQEIVAFAEQISKQFSLAGTSAQGAQAAMLQLTQAMSSGVLRGEELNSVLEQAPTIAQAIAEYMGVSIGEMRELASQGEVTAQVVKNALFRMAEETDKAAANVPMTFGRVWEDVGSAAVKAMEPAMGKLNDLLNSDLGQKAVNGLISGVELLGGAATWVIDKLSSGAQWVADHGDLVSAVLAGIGAAALVVGARMAATGAQMARAAFQSAIAWAAANWPLLLIVGIVSLVIYMARKMGATWEDVGRVVGGVFGLMYAFAMNSLIIPAYNAFAYLGNFVGNFLNDPIAAIKILFIDLAAFVLGKISDMAHGMENLINKIPGMSVNLTSGIDGLYNKVKGAAQSARDAAGWTEYFKSWDYLDYADTWNKWSQAGAGIGKALDEFSLQDALDSFSGDGFDYSAMMGNIPDTLNAIKDDTAAIKRSVALSEEDVKLLVDMAERKYIINNNLTAQAPVITINGQNTGDSAEDLQWLENALQKILMEQAASHTDLSYA